MDNALTIYKECLRCSICPVLIINNNYNKTTNNKTNNNKTTNNKTTIKTTNNKFCELLQNNSVLFSNAFVEYFVFLLTENQNKLYSSNNTSSNSSNSNSNNNNNNHINNYINNTNTKTNTNTNTKTNTNTNTNTIHKNNNTTHTNNKTTTNNQFLKISSKITQILLDFIKTNSSINLKLLITFITNSYYFDILLTKQTKLELTDLFIFITKSAIQQKTTNKLIINHFLLKKSYWINLLTNNKSMSSYLKIIFNITDIIHEKILVEVSLLGIVILFIVVYCLLGIVYCYTYYYYIYMTNYITIIYNLSYKNHNKTYHISY